MILGLFLSFFGFLGLIYKLIFISYNSMGLSIVAVIMFFSGIQLVCMGILGEYIGKVYMEVKQRPRYIISERTDNALKKSGKKG